MERGESLGRKTKKYLGHPMIVTVKNRYKGIMNRCERHYWDKVPNYYGTTVCDEWKENFDSFFEWFVENCVDVKDQIDKDIIGRDSRYKHYSPETCLIVPAEVNYAMWVYPKNPTFPEKKYMGSYGKCVYRSLKGKPDTVTYEARFTKEGNKTSDYIGNYKTEYEAHDAWRHLKIDRFIQLSEKYEKEYPKMVSHLKAIALEMCIDASLGRPTEWPH